MRSKHLPQITEDQLIGRAIRAYWTVEKNASLAPDQPGWKSSKVEEIGGKTYVLLGNINGTLAVYRVRNDGILKRLVRWPKEIETVTG
jgi:hypothetical protein